MSILANHIAGKPVFAPFVVQRMRSGRIGNGAAVRQAALSRCKPFSRLTGGLRAHSRRGSAARGEPARFNRVGGERTDCAVLVDELVVGSELVVDSREEVGTLVMSLREGARFFDEAVVVANAKGGFLYQVFPEISAQYARFFDFFSSIKKTRKITPTGSNTPYQST